MCQILNGATAALVGAAACVQHLQPSDLAAAPIRFQSDTNSILTNLGQPPRRERTDAGPYGWLEIWYYPHITLTFQSSSRCSQIRILDSTVPTPRGVRVGDAVRTVLASCGRSASLISRGDTLFLSYSTPDRRSAIVFVTTRDTVRSVSIGQQGFVFM